MVGLAGRRVTLLFSPARNDFEMSILLTNRSLQPFELAGNERKEFDRIVCSERFAKAFQLLQAVIVILLAVMVDGCGRSQKVDSNRPLDLSSRGSTNWSGLIAAANTFVVVSNNNIQTTQSPQTAIEQNDGHKLVADALVVAQRDRKRVLLQFTTRYCTWCHILKKLLETDQSLKEELDKDYQYVLIDITGGNNTDVDAQYGDNPTMELPLIVVLDSDGKRLARFGHGIVEGDPKHYHINPKTMLDFLSEWTPKGDKAK